MSPTPNTKSWGLLLSPSIDLLHKPPARAPPPYIRNWPSNLQLAPASTIRVLPSPWRDGSDRRGSLMRTCTSRESHSHVRTLSLARAVLQEGPAGYDKLHAI